MSSEVFENLENDLEDLFDQLEVVLDGIKRSNGGQQDELRRFRGDLVQARRSIERMENEAKKAPGQFRGQMLEKVRMFREKSALMQKELNKAAKSVVTNPMSTASTNASAQDVIQSTSQSLTRSHRVALETEDVGAEILSDLGVQRETLERTRVRLQETDAELSRSRRILRKMYFGVLQNKALLIVIILVEICILGAVIYDKYIKKK